MATCAGGIRLAGIHVAGIHVAGIRLAVGVAVTAALHARAIG
ncbi:MAG: hypothetical protein ACKOCW_08035 [Planctomycetaceae bacterium]